MKHILMVSLVALFLISVSVGILFIYIYLKNKFKVEREVREAILNAEDLQRHAEDVAIYHTVSGKAKSSRRVLPRMEDNYKFIIKTYKELNDDVKQKKVVVPAAEWLFDNFYVLEEQVKEIRMNFPKGYYAALPRLMTGDLKGFPRLYAIALELVSHTDGRVDEKVLIDFISSYQSKSNLTSGELWAVPIMAKIALIENVRLICQDILENREERIKAEKIVDSIFSKQSLRENALEYLDSEIKAMDNISPAFAEHIIKSIRNQGEDVGTLLHLLDEKLSFQDSTLESITAMEHQEQAKNQVSIGNSITSLRLISGLNWSEIFEKISSVEEALRRDNVYCQMDFKSRDYYRHEIEKMARSLNISETIIAKKAVEIAESAAKNKQEDMGKSHVGYYIVGKGREEFEREIGLDLGLKDRCVRFMKKYPSLVYISSISIITISLSLLFARTMAYNRSPIIVALAIFIAILPSSEIGVGAVNWLVNHTMKPYFFPKLEFIDGIPKDAATIVVIPTLLPNKDRVKSLLDDMEVYYLANKEDNLYFALLGDFCDSKTENNPEDSEIVECALEGVKRLNKKYSLDDLGNIKNKQDIFYFFNRYRKYNSSEGIWMGWERKRGKLLEFARLLRGDLDTTYYIKSGEGLKVKYIITLDADTKLPRTAAKRLIGAMYHPLNRAYVGEDNRVKSGYGIMQPRVNIDVNNANKTYFSRVFAGQGGIDPYTTAVSDVYQDLFGEGIFTGKGIIDLDVFLKTLNNSLPENKILSHDLLEGSYARTGLVTDIELVDGFPARYNSYAARLHRWVRGDWQIIGWLRKTVKNGSGVKVKNPLSMKEKWKVFDNIRRSLMAPSIIMLFIMWITVFNDKVLPAALLLFFAIAFPVFGNTVDALLIKTRADGRSCRVFPGLKYALYQVSLLFVFLPYQAYLMLNAITKTLVRLVFTNKNLLEWETAADVEKRLKTDGASFYKSMWVVDLFSAILIVLTFVYFKGLRPMIIIFASIWAVSPSVAYKISKDIDKRQVELDGEDSKNIRKISRKIWSFFEDFVTGEDNYLPPDNYQEEPQSVVAHRTSPTNIGLYLVSALSARDLGYITTTNMIDSLEKTFSTIEKLDTWKGHLYNWYDTVNLNPLRPFYVSSVDSGNFIGYLVTLKEGLDEYLRKPIVDNSYISGLIDTMEILCEENKIDINIDFLRGFMGNKDLELTILNSILLDLENALNDMDDSIWRNKALNMVKSLLQEIREIFPFIEDINMYDTNTNNNNSTIKSLGLEEGFKAISKGTGLIEISNGYRAILKEIKDLEEDEYVRKLKSTIMGAYLHVNRVISRIKIIKKRCIRYINSTNFKYLYDEKRQLFSIGYSLEDEQLNRSYYDLLASESRQTSFIAIAKGDISEEHWFRLGRPLTSVGGEKGLVSWSGTMFEYMMPLLIMKNYKNTLMDETYKFVIKAQMEYAKKRDCPWGVSESAYNAFDILFNYQYRAFGVPALGLKRGLVNDMVVAPYATILAFMVDFSSSMSNLYYLKDEGLEGKYGFYEAADYTPGRLPIGKKHVVVKNFMAHHLGMSMLAINNILNQNIMQERFSKDPMVKSAELLLQEKVPNRIITAKDIEEEIIPFEKEERHVQEFYKVIKSPILNFPEAHIISNGKYNVVLTNTGSGYSRCNTAAISRWREDKIESSFGMFFYIQNINSNMVWSAAYEPCRVLPEEYKAIFSSDKIEYLRVDGSIDTHTEIVVSPEDNAEIRRISLTNHSDHRRVIEVTSYFEVVMSSQAADTAHRAFNNLFVKTEYLQGLDAILAERRNRDADKEPVWLYHSVVVEGDAVGPVQYETDRMKFIGRNRGYKDPEALDVDHPLSNTTGAVIDPIMSIRKRLSIESGKTVRISYITGIEDGRDKVLERVKKYSDISNVKRAFELAWTRSQVEGRYLNLTEKKIEVYQRVLSHIVYLSPLRRKIKDLIVNNKKGQSGLWSFGISGDLPIVLVSIKNSDEIDIVYEALELHEYLRLKGFKMDLVILNENKGDYMQSLNNQLKSMIESSHAGDIKDTSGGVFLRQSEEMGREEKTLLFSVARICFKGDGGSLSKQIQGRNNQANRNKNIVLGLNSKKDIYEEHREEAKDLVFFNEIGGFNKDGNEYVIYLNNGNVTPAPWSNVVSNGNFGFLTTENGSMYTWSENSRENKLTPWSNDPVVDPSGEVIYIRDEDGEYENTWTITPGPIRDKNTYIIKHGFGYTAFNHTAYGISQEEKVFVPVSDNVKIYSIKLKNISGKKRKISATLYIRPVLGVHEDITSPFIVTSSHKETGVMLIKNSYTDEFYGRYAFLDSSILDRSITGDRLEFIGLGGDSKNPQGITKGGLSGRIGAGLDPCAAMKVLVELDDGEEKEFVFTLGQGKSEEDAVNIALKYRDVDYVKEAFNQVANYWGGILGSIKVKTPDISLDLMANGWLLYQTISCRIMARSAFYQSGGAFGFRDQLQDVLAAGYVCPDMQKRQILTSASHQFLEGDVQHWWHPEGNKGIRTRFSDDLLWLPYVCIDYIDLTGDYSILDDLEPYLEDEPLGEDEDERYNKPRVSNIQESIYDHCIKAIDRSLKFGEHGIPLMGSGDWNDGMNTVGNKGKGESIWLGWFLYDILTRFSNICRYKKDFERADNYIKTADKIVESIEKNGWDGSWYRRAYFDNGKLLGSASNMECRIDSIAQSWAAISGGARHKRVVEAMGALEQYLVRRSEGLIALLTPPFDNSDLEPGYIKAYVPGVRENGGQYTHAAVWVVLGFTKFSMGDKAWEYFNMINPINHSRTAMEITKYKVEPYVMAADVYAAEPHIGRGGWTWYTGAAGWMYRVCIENMLGLKIRGSALLIDPCIPKSWREYSIRYTYQNTHYIINIKNPYGLNSGVKSIYLDGNNIEKLVINLVNDNKEHYVDVTLGEAP